jgi:hypothetical protein
MEFSRFPIPTPVQVERPSPPEPVVEPARKQTPSIEEACATVDAAESAWRQAALQAQLASDPNTAAAALMMASQAASKSAQAQTVYAEARAKVSAGKRT